MKNLIVWKLLVVQDETPKWHRDEEEQGDEERTARRHPQRFWPEKTNNF